MCGKANLPSASRTTGKGPYGFALGRDQSAQTGLRTVQSEYKAAAIQDEYGCSCWFLHSQKGCISMCIQAFGLRHHCCNRTDNLRCAFIERNQANDFDEVPHIE